MLNATMLSALLWNLVLTAGLAVVLTALGRLPWLGRRPSLRHWLWLLLLAKLVAPPLFPLPLLPAAADDAAAAAMAPADGDEHLGLASEQGMELARPVDVAPSARPDPDARGVAPQDVSGRRQALLLGGLLAVSLAGTGVLLAVHGVRAVKLIRRLRWTGAEDPLLAESCASVASRLRIRGVVRSCVVDARTTPLLCAWRGPLVVLPRQLLDDLTPQQLHSIVAHELAHLVRRDHWANVFAFLVKALMWWNPVVWWADRELRAAQELCCDAMAIDHCRTDRRSYATTLLKALDFIQAEPWTPRALAAGMGSRTAILRRFSMIGETRLSYRLSRWTSLGLLALVIPLLCIPVRAQEKKPAAKVAATAAGCGAAEAAAQPGAKATAPAKAEPAKSAADTPPLDPKIRELGEAVHKRITTYSDVQTLTLKDGQTGRMKVKKNLTPVAEILITPHLVQRGTKFDLEALDAAGKPVEGSKASSYTIHDADSERMGLGKIFRVDGQTIFAKIQLTPKRQGRDKVTIEVKALFARVSSPREIEAMLLTQGKSGQMRLHFIAISGWVMEYQLRTGHYPKNLAELKKTLPKDAYSPAGADYHYEAQRNRFLLSSCGKDGIYGNDDDEFLIGSPGGTRTGQRHEIYPLEEEKGQKEGANRRPNAQRGEKEGANRSPNAQRETIYGVRPRGDCSISGKVVAEATGKPVENATMSLFYLATHGSIFVKTASDGTFTIKDIPKGPFSLSVSHTPGYQDASYNPEGKPGPFPAFSLQDGEHRSGIVLKVKPACRISGKVVDENGNLPDRIETLSVLAWFQRSDGGGYENRQAYVNRADGSYLIDGLSGKPVYIMAINRRAAREGNAFPPIYYPSTFSRGDARQITFDKSPSVEGVDIRLRKQGGIAIEGTVRDEAGKPVPEAFVVAHHRDMLFDFATAYTDAQGHYRIPCLGEGEFLVHVDAVHRGFVRTRTPVDLGKASTKVKRDFTLHRGVLISGKLVDENGKPWRIGSSFGRASVFAHDPAKDAGSPYHSFFSLTKFRNKHRPEDTLESSGGSFSRGEGDYADGEMIFPTEATFILQGMMPGHTLLDFRPNKEGQAVLKILHGGQDIKTSGLDTKPGQEIKDISIVIGAAQPADAAQPGQPPAPGAAAAAPK